MVKTVVNNFVDLLPYPIQNSLKAYRNRSRRGSVIREWEARGKPLPPPHQVKQMAIEYYKSLYGFDILIETGTYLGNMILAQKDNFSRIYSIELGEQLWKNAVNRFKDYGHITIMHGDSGKVLNTITGPLDKPAIFWLDGHYSGGITAKGEKACPILAEVDAIMGHQKLNHVLLVDDARCFNGKGTYPTIEELTSYIQNKNPGYVLENKDDILRFTVPKE
ncbi:MAG TPA: hypothetical protein VI603_18685 [Saprospiraceae bacterium]|nr:hypothetical protein [Saprospiraceae bacterium]